MIEHSGESLFHAAKGTRAGNPVENADLFGFSHLNVVFHRDCEGFSLRMKDDFQVETQFFLLLQEILNVLQGLLFKVSHAFGVVAGIVQVQRFFDKKNAFGIRLFRVYRQLPHAVGQLILDVGVPQLFQKQGQHLFQVHLGIMGKSESLKSQGNGVMSSAFNLIYIYLWRHNHKNNILPASWMSR